MMPEPCDLSNATGSDADIGVRHGKLVYFSLPAHS